MSFSVFVDNVKHSFLYILCLRVFQVLMKELFIGANKIIETIKQSYKKGKRIKQANIRGDDLEEVDFAVSIPVIHVAVIVFEERLQNGITIMNMKPDIASSLLEYDNQSELVCLTLTLLILSALVQRFLDVKNLALTLNHMDFFTVRRVRGIQLCPTNLSFTYLKGFKYGQ